MCEVLDGYTEKAQVFSVFCRGTYDGECELSRGFGAKQTDLANSGEKNPRYIQAIKQNEIAPNTEYLFKDVDKNNGLDSSIQKLVIESMDFVPRT